MVNFSDCSIKEANKSFFDKWSKKYDKDNLSSYFSYCHEKLFKIMNLKEDSRILDIGCGTGEAFKKISRLLNRCFLYGIDISKGMITKAKSKNFERNHAQFIVAESNSIPYKDEYFDFVFTTNSFHHYEDPVKTLKETKRVLKSGGSFFLLDVCRTVSLSIKIWDLYHRLIKRGHKRYYSTIEIEDFLKSAGYNNINLKFNEKGFFKYKKLFFSIQLWQGIKK